MRTCKIYLANKSDINNATEFYINMIQTALEALDIVVEKVYTLSDLKNADYVLTVDAKAAFFVRVRYPLKKNHRLVSGSCAGRGIHGFR